MSQELQFSDALTFLFGNHNVRTGVMARQSKFDLFQIPQPRGAFRFSGEFTGDAMGDALLGLASQTDIQNITDVKNTTWYYAVFVQDDWRVTDNLTLNLGLRWEYTSATKESQNRQSNFDYATGQILVAGQNGNSPGLINVDENDFAPRFGFAWTPGRQQHLGRPRRLGHVLQQRGAADRVPARLQSAVLLLGQPVQRLRRHARRPSSTRASPRSRPPTPSSRG